MTPPATRPRPGLDRATLVATAAELADAHGLRGVTLSAVARAAGVRTPSLYSHLGGTDDLMAGLTALALTELAERGDRALAGRSGRDALVALATVHRDYAHEHPGRFEAASALHVPIDDELRAAGVRVSDQTLAVLRGYPIADEERVHAIRLVASVLRGFVQLEAGAAFGHREPSSEASWHRVIDALDDTLRHWGRSDG